MLGVDGCKAGWVGALLRGSTYDVLVAADIAGLVDAARQLAPGLAVVAVDIPIGLPDDRPRTTDVLARSQLPVGRKSSVFPTPSRAAVEHTTHPEASAANREAVGVGLSVQAFHLVPKILDVDRYVARDPPVPVVEAHPEVTFAEIDPACVVPSKTTRDGTRGSSRRTQRRRARATGPPARARGTPPTTSSTPAPSPGRPPGTPPARRTRSPTHPRSSPTASRPRSGCEPIVPDVWSGFPARTRRKTSGTIPGDRRFRETHRCLRESEA